MSLLPPLLSNEKHSFHLQSKIKWTMQGICPVTCANGTLMFKLQAEQVCNV